MKVLHLIDNAEHCYFLYPLIDYCDRARFEVIYGTLSSAGVMHGEMEARGIRTFALGCGRRWEYPLAVLRLARILRREKIDIVHAHLFHACVVGLSAARLSGRARGIFTAQHTNECVLWADLHRRPQALWLDSISSGWLAHRAVALSDQGRDLLVRREGVAADKVVVLANAIDLSRFRPSVAARDRIRAEFGLRPDHVVIGSTSRLNWVKRLDMLIRSYAALRGEFPDLKLMLIGSGAEEGALRREAADLSVEDGLIITGQRGDVPDLLSAIDVYAHTALTESFCLAIGEAAAMGLPVVSTDVGIARDLIEEDVSGYVVPPDDEPLFRQALRRVLLTPARWRAMGEAGRCRVRVYSADRVTREFEALYARMSSHGGRLKVPAMEV